MSLPPTPPPATGAALEVARGATAGRSSRASAGDAAEHFGRLVEQHLDDARARALADRARADDQRADERSRDDRSDPAPRVADRRRPAAAGAPGARESLHAGGSGRTHPASADRADAERTAADRAVVDPTDHDRTGAGEQATASTQPTQAGQPGPVDPSGPTGRADVVAQRHRVAREGQVPTTGPAGTTPAATPGPGAHSARAHRAGAATALVARHASGGSATPGVADVAEGGPSRPAVNGARPLRTLPGAPTGTSDTILTGPITGSSPSTHPAPTGPTPGPGGHGMGPIGSHASGSTGRDGSAAGRTDHLAHRVIEPVVIEPVEIEPVEIEPVEIGSGKTGSAGLAGLDRAGGLVRLDRPVVSTSSTGRGVSTSRGVSTGQEVATGREPTALSTVAPLVPFAAAGAAQSPTHGAATPSAVVAQLVPAVSRLVQRGDGTSRLTLKLHPADLGELHLTVSVKGSGVAVTVAAGPEARAALAEGTGRLRTLLADLGHDLGAVTLRDLPGGAASSPTGGLAADLAAGLSTSTGGRPGSEQSSHHPGHLGHRSDHPAGGDGSGLGDPGGRPDQTAGQGADGWTGRDGGAERRAPADPSADRGRTPAGTATRDHAGRDPHPFPHRTTGAVGLDVTL